MEFGGRFARLGVRSGRAPLDTPNLAVTHFLWSRPSSIWAQVVFVYECGIDSLLNFAPVLDHHKYRNNYDYNKSIYLVNKEPHLDSGFFLVRESEELVSPISVIFYETYQSEAELNLRLASQQDKIQAITSEHGWYAGSIPFGTAQEPALWDYADGVDTLEFLDAL